MEIETSEDLANQLADWLGIYGGCKNETADDNNCIYDKSKPFCCRQGFCSALQERIRGSVKNDKIVNQI